ncbi:MAG: 5-(carboxyamino)imidazole ribonucleotide synthase, partial [Boseongicola sp. SB0662_bin_57]|nr:5-(carboxyamino)imidazole ribonucleotide synthase [Boseongicola sp. SB0662_bin_57]
DLADVPAIAREDGARLHLYGKTETRAGRKMGHVTRVLGPATGL